MWCCKSVDYFHYPSVSYLSITSLMLSFYDITSCITAYKGGRTFYEKRNLTQNGGGRLWYYWYKTLLQTALKMFNKLARQINFPQ